MVKRIGIIIVGATLVVAHYLIGGTAFAAIQENGDPCPPECVTDTMEIMTWYPSPWNSYEELYTMKLGVGDVTTSAGEANLRPKTVGSIKVERSVVFKPMAEDPVPEKDLYTGEYTNVEQGEMIYNSGEDKFKYFNGSTWVPQTGGGSNPIIFFSCLWRYDYNEGVKGNGEATNWGCQPQDCPTPGWSQVGNVYNDQVSIACPGSTECYWGPTPSSTHPVSAGRSVRACMKQ